MAVALGDSFDLWHDCFMESHSGRNGVLMALALVAAIWAVSSCAGEAPKPRDSGPADQYVPPPDVYVAPDIYVQPDVWPDTTTPDTWVPQPDTYTGQNFGCEIDADCFGRVCCETPWGVKMCADSCAEAP